MVLQDRNKGLSGDAPVAEGGVGGLGAGRGTAAHLWTPTTLTAGSEVKTGISPPHGGEEGDMRGAFVVRL